MTTQHQPLTSDATTRPLDPATRRSLEHLLDYLWEDEHKHWLESEPGGHIFDDLLRVRRWLDHA